MKWIALGVTIVAGAAVAVLLMAAPEPLRLNRSGTAYPVTVLMDKATTGTIEANVEVPMDVTAVSLDATMPQMGHAAPEVVATQEKPGSFVARGELFAMAGVWELAVRVRGTSGEDVVTFEITVN